MMIGLVFTAMNGSLNRVMTLSVHFVPNDLIPLMRYIGKLRKHLYVLNM